MEIYRSTDFTHYAILIGVDAYPSSPLKSCVRDADNVRSYLERKLASVHIDIFTATARPNASTPGLLEPPERRPTFSNIRASLVAITDLAKAGDFVYIHFSGHGVRGEPYGTFSRSSTGDLALVLLEGDDADGERYLWGPELAFWLKELVDKDVAVTLVLDCCFSATVYRREGDEDVRSIPYDAAVDSKYPMSLDDSLRGDDAGARPVSMQPNWLVEPDGYAILAACGPDEFAKGVKDMEGRRHGALSYYLLESLDRCGGLGKGVHAIHRRLRAIFRECWPQQNPVLFGNKRQGFFGPVRLESDDDALAPIVRYRDGPLQLQAGRAHGVCDGDWFEVRPADSDSREDGSASARGDYILAKVARAGPLTSVLELTGSQSCPVQTGWIANSHHQRALRSFPVQLGPGIPRPDEWMTAMANRLLNLCTDQDQKVDGQPACFQIALNGLGEFEIHDEIGQRMANVQTWQRDQPHASTVWDVVGCVEHLVRYRMVRDLGRGLDSADDPFRLSFDIQLTDPSGMLINPDCATEVTHDERLELVVTNKGTSKIYLYVYYLDPFWQIENVLKAGYECILPRQTDSGFEESFTQKLRMMFPSRLRDRGLRQCEDIIKVFITSQPTCFDLLELPALGGSARKKPDGDRVPKGSGYSTEAWAAVNFVVCTIL